MKLAALLSLLSSLAFGQSVLGRMITPHCQDESTFPATTDETRSAILCGTDAGTKLYGSPGDGGAWFLVAPAASSGSSGTVTSVSVTTANGVSGSVATSTTTPAITLTLGAITPASVAAVGSVTGSNLSGTHSGTSSGTNTGDQTSVSGNAGTATALQTPRTIDGVSFDGTANIVGPCAGAGVTGNACNSAGKFAYDAGVYVTGGMLVRDNFGDSLPAPGRMYVGYSGVEGGSFAFGVYGTSGGGAIGAQGPNGFAYTGTQDGVGRTFTVTVGGALWAAGALTADSVGASGAITGNSISITNGISENTPQSQGFQFNGNAILYQAPTTLGTILRGLGADGSSAFGVASDTSATFSTGGSKIHSFRNNTVEKAYVDYSGIFVGQGATLTTPLAASSGGNGSTAVTAGGIAYGDGTTRAMTSSHTAGQCVKWNGSSAPTAGDCTAGQQLSFSGTEFDSAATVTANEGQKFAGGGVFLTDGTTQALTCAWHLPPVGNTDQIIEVSIRDESGELCHCTISNCDPTSTDTTGGSVSGGSINTPRTCACTGGSLSAGRVGSITVTTNSTCTTDPGQIHCNALFTSP